MDINDLQSLVYAQAVERGLYKNNPSAKRLLHHIREEGNEIISAYYKYGDLKTHYECKSMLIEDCDKVDFNCEACPYRSNEGVPQEMADVIIMTLSACEHLGIDAEEAIKEKMQYNAIRKR